MIEENVPSETNNFQKKNRKRKKSFLRTALRHGKRGKFGHGTQLTEDTYLYFVNSLDLFRKGFENDEEKQIFANNVLEQTKDNEVNYSQNQIGSRLIEELIPLADDECFERFIKAFSEDLRPILSDTFASHVLQKMVLVAAHKSILKEDSIFHPFTLKISKFVLNNLEDFVWDRYANPIIRTIMSSLSGIFETNKNSNYKNVEISEVPNEFIEIVKEFATRLSQWPQFGDLAYDDLTSGLLQSFLPTLRKIDKKQLKVIVKKMLDDCFLGDEYKKRLENVDETGSDQTPVLPSVFSSSAAIRLLEEVLCNSTKKLFTKIYLKCFLRNLIVLAKTKDANFSVQKLINNCQDKETLEAIFDEIKPEIENILITGHSGIVLSLAQACQRLGCRQGQFFQQLSIALHCEASDKIDSIVPCILRLVPYERLTAVENAPISLHGTLIIESLLNFKKPITIINSLLNMQLEDLKKVFCDTKGCHIMDSFMTSEFVGEKSREKLIWKLFGIYQDLATSKHGSRSLDALWVVTNIKQKLRIMDELVQKDEGWKNTECGKIMASKLNIALYKRSKDQWKQSLNNEDKKKNLFADIIGSK